MPSRSPRGLALLGSGASASLVTVVPALVLLGAGIGCVWEVVVVVVQAGVGEAEVGTATGANNLLREIGVVVGTGGRRRLGDAPADDRRRGRRRCRSRPGARNGSPRHRPPTQAAVSAAYADAFGPAFWALVPVALLAAVAFSRLRRWSRP